MQENPKNLSSARRWRKEFSKRIGIRKFDSQALEDELCSIRGKIDTLYSDIHFTEEDVQKDNDISESISLLEEKAKDSLSKIRSRNRERIYGLNSEKFKLIEDIREEHNLRRKDFLQVLEETFSELCKDIENNDNDTVALKAELEAVTLSYMTVRTRVLGEDTKVRTDRNIERYNGLIREAEDFGQAISEIITDYKKIASGQDYEDIQARLKRVHAEHQKKVRRLVKRRSRVFSAPGNELFDYLVAELGDFKVSGYQGKRKAIAGDRKKLEWMEKRLESPDRKTISECLDLLGALQEDRYKHYEDTIYLKEDIRDYRSALTELKKAVKDRLPLFLESPDEPDYSLNLEEDERRAEKAVEDAKEKIAWNRRFSIIGETDALRKVEEEISESVSSAEEKLRYLRQTRERYSLIEKETARFLNAIANRDTSIEIDKPDFSIRMLYIDNPYLEETGREYGETVRTYITKKEQWIEEDKEKEFEMILRKHEDQTRLERLKAELELKKKEIAGLERKKHAEPASAYFDLIDWMDEHVIPPGDDRLHEASMIIKGTSRKIRGRCMRIGERILSAECRDMIESYIANPKHEYESDKRFRKDLALGIVEAVASPGEISEGIEQGIYDAQDFYDLANMLDP